VNGSRRQIVWPLWPCLGLLAGLIIVSPSLNAKGKKSKAAPKDEIEVVGHVPLTGGPVNRFFTTQHFSSYYLYAEHETGGTATLIDVTKISQPVVLADVVYQPNSNAGGLSVVAGTAALISSNPVANAPASPPQTIRIMDFSDPKSPKVAREFVGVTAMSNDQRGMIFIANADGVWILQQHLALDPEVEEAYARYVLTP
jgi:hypothetical protein